MTQSKLQENKLVMQVHNVADIVKKSTTVSFG